MPVFHVTLRRSVSRVVEIHKESLIAIEAPSQRIAAKAAKALCSREDINSFCRGWYLDESSPASLPSDVVNETTVKDMRQANWSNPPWVVPAKLILKPDDKSKGK